MDHSRTLLVGIGASGAEGLSDVLHLLELLPRQLNAAVLVTVHRSSDSVSHLRDVLSLSSSLPVEIAVNGATPLPGVCYIGTPRGILTVLDNGCFQLADGSNNRLRNQTIDALLHSLALSHGPAIGVILSGFLSDGSGGLAAIHQAGGLTAVLDPKRKPCGMQANAITFGGQIDIIGSHADIAQFIQVTCGLTACASPGADGSA
ncbi:chemotaxis protein CheB [Paraburkholderia strydomiana]|uniref:chemotaxis protein CheB n=1 Tax=Paraburkholderia strydomiana TaxID=1245417 RepID=UPI001BED066C|nr:chemotaxis protein CheB [Paraburkholderia strydomiana]MBT2792864.1 hypothetical protein [Paraburkholderia strydomiana]